MRVELDIFSGRPNPAWELDARTAATFATLLGSRPATTAATIEAPALGYRGFRYRSGSIAGRAYRGSITIDGSIAGTRFADPSCEIEHFLLMQLPSEWAAIRPLVERALAGD